VTDPWPTLEANVVGTINLLEASVRESVDRFIFASSNAAVGEQVPPINEKMLPRPVSPYGASKLAGEAYCTAFHGSRGLDTVILRFANVYGPYSDHKTSVVAKLIRQMLNGQPLTVYGDGSQTRDFIHVSDVVEGISRALDCEVAGETFQIGTGTETSVIELLEALEQVSGRKPAIHWLPLPAGEIRRNYSSIDHARARLGFEPKFDLMSGLADTMRWLSRVANSTP
jgi:UDP-glucose 4-epimerase